MSELKVCQNNPKCHAPSDCSFCDCCEMCCQCFGDIVLTTKQRARIDYLEAELANRPVVYIDVIDGKRRESSRGIPVLYIQKQIDECLSDLAFEPYTGEQK